MKESSINQDEIESSKESIKILPEELFIKKNPEFVKLIDKTNEIAKELWNQQYYQEVLQLFDAECANLASQVILLIKSEDELKEYSVKMLAEKLKEGFREVMINVMAGFLKDKDDKNLDVTYDLLSNPELKTFNKDHVKDLKPEILLRTFKKLGKLDPSMGKLDPSKLVSLMLKENLDIITKKAEHVFLHETALHKLFINKLLEVLNKEEQPSASPSASKASAVSSASAAKSQP